ncbi:MAG: MFS transporter [Nocardioides sp.]
MNEPMTDDRAPRPTPAAPVSSETVPGAWAPLRIRLFRFLWMAGIVSNLGTFMHTVGAGWAITDLTDNPTLVSLLQAMWAAPGFLIALLAGALADVIDRRKLMLVTQFASMVIAGALGLLALTDRLTVGLLLALTFALSVAGTLAAPAFMAVTPELVEQPQLPQAIALNSISMNIAQAAGPALAGLVIAAAGAGAVFLVNALSFLGVVFVVRQYRPVVDRTLPAEHVGAAMRIGIRYVRNSPRLQVLAARIVLSIVVTSALAALLPIVARQRLDATAGEFGLMSAAMGIGALAAVWALPGLRQRVGAEGIVFLASVVWAAGTAAVAVTDSLLVAAAGLALAGGAGMTTMTTVFSIYQTLLPAWVRGRASSVAMLVIWLGASVGAVVWGVVGSAVGLRDALLVAAVANVVTAGLAGLALRIGSGDPVDITPVHWGTPQIALEPAPDDGPVLVSVEWRIASERAEDFAAAMAVVERQRRRDGAMQWRLYHDMAEPGRVIETFTVATWAEHERQHQRSIGADEIEQRPAREMLIDGDPVVSHLIAQYPVRQHGRRHLPGLGRRGRGN